MIAFDNSENRFKNAAVALNYGRKYAHGEILGYTHQNFLRERCTKQIGWFREEQKIERSKVFSKMILFSKCRYLFTSITQGSKFSYVLNDGKYVDEYGFDLSLYS